jgi:hypothetical protein
VTTNAGTSEDLFRALDIASSSTFRETVLRSHRGNRSRHGSRGDDAYRHSADFLNCDLKDGGEGAPSRM